MKPLFWIPLLLAMGFAHADVKPVKNQEAVTTIKRERVLFMYTMKTRFWDDGTRVTVMYQEPSSSVHRDFCLKVLDVTPTRFAQLVDTYLNNGNASYYRRVFGAAEMREKVASINGAIGYLDADLVAINNGDKHVQILRIVD